MYYNTKMNTLNPGLIKELSELGQYLRALRVQHQFTLTDMCERIGANPRTVSKIEKGDPTVSIGVFMQYLDILGISHGVAIRILGDFIHAVQPKRKKVVFRDEDMDF
jgi:transcriptional regulator with XRE-family HTH domain